MAKLGSLFFLTLFLQHHHTSASLIDRRSIASTAEWQPMYCNAVAINPSCNSFLYVTPEGRNLSEIVSVFSGNSSLTRPIKRHSGSEDLLVGVSCMCEAINDTLSAFFHDTQYKVDQGNTPDTVKINKFSGLAMNIGDGKVLITNETITVHLPCGCSPTASDGVLSYAVQEEDTLSTIASVFGSSSQDILNLNPSVTNPDFIKPGWILFIPMGVTGSSKKSESMIIPN